MLEDVNISNIRNSIVFNMDNTEASCDGSIAVRWQTANIRWNTWSYIKSDPYVSAIDFPL